MQLVVALALGAALHAFSAHLSLAALLIAVTVAGILAFAFPAGGGMGVAETGLILALTAGGICELSQPALPHAALLSIGFRRGQVLPPEKWPGTSRRCLLR